jgi:2-methylisocitrate lyase-like PEP mutase family enzyme
MQSMNSQGRRGADIFRQMLASRRFLQLPGVYDGITALAAAQAGFGALYLTGYGVHASLGLPDVGLASQTEFAQRAAVVEACTGLPLVVDGDSGFGSPANVWRMMRDFERAGAAAVQIDDQEAPRRCGHTPGKRVVSTPEMVQRLRVAVDSRGDTGPLVIARTDALQLHGLDEALRRCEAYARAGADVLFVDAPESEDQMATIGRAFDLPLMANMVPGGKTPLLSAQVLHEMGFAFAIYPSIAWLASAGAIRAVFESLREDRVSPTLSGPPLTAEEGHTLVGFPDMWAFERRYALSDGEA